MSVARGILRGRRKIEVSCREQGNVQDRQGMAFVFLLGAEKGALRGALKAKSAFVRMHMAASRAGVGP